MKLTQEEQDILDSYERGEWEPLEDSAAMIAGLREAAAETIRASMGTAASGLVVLDPDLRALFPDSASVNQALRALAAKRQA